MRQRVLIIPVLLGLVFSFGCDDESEVEAIDETPIVGVMELPISLRNRDSAPASAAHIEISPNELRLDHRKLLDLSGGNLPEGEVLDHVITALRTALTSGPARRAATLRVHVNTPYLTTVEVLKTLKAVNIHEVAFEVRPIGGGAATGWLLIDDFRVEAEGDEPHEFAQGVQRQWDELVRVWEESYEGCRRDHYVDCAHKPANPMSGGKLAITLFARGSALKAELVRFGAEEEDEPSGGGGGAQMLEGVPAPVGGDGEEEGPPPVGHGAFTWRFQAAVDELSPVVAAFRPLCGAAQCGTIVTGDTNTMTGRITSFLGAFYPDGATKPHVVFEIPEN